jgi:hypothetical protein
VKMNEGQIFAVQLALGGKHGRVMRQGAITLSGSAACMDPAR